MFKQKRKFKKSELLRSKTPWPHSWEATKKRKGQMPNSHDGGPNHIGGYGYCQRPDTVKAEGHILSYSGIMRQTAQACGCTQYV